MVSADFLGEVDDTYIGLQMTTFLDTKSARFFPTRNQYSYLLIKQQDGIKEGIAVTRDRDGNQILNYLRPSAGLEISEASISQYAVPLMNLESNDDTRTNRATSNAGAGLAVLLAFTLILKHDLEKDWKPVD
jgi:hypothetical protein